MKKLFSTKYSAGAVNAAMLLLRLGLGILIMNHGFQKLTHFSETAQHLPSLFGMGGNMSAALSIFAEFFCALFVMIGLFTRLACIPLIINLSVALFKAHHMNFFGAGELPSLFLAGFITILIIGPGRVSIDEMIGK